MVRKVALIAAGVLLLGIGPARADETVMDQLYGNGVHAYFGGQFSQAYDSLTTAIQAGTHDPRVYYFRGLAELQLGRQPDAGADWQKGAALEADDTTGQYSVSQALERIQGSTRTALDQFRESARAVAMQRDVRQKRNLFDQSKSGDAVLMRHDAPAVELTPPTPDQVVAKKPAIEDKAAAVPKLEEPMPVPAAGEKATAVKPIDSTDPFSGDAKKPAEAGVEKPAENPAENPAAAATPPADAPKGAEAPAVAPPAGTPPAATPPAAKGAAKPADSGDPFGSDPTPAGKPAEKPADKPADKAAPAPAGPAAATAPTAGDAAAAKPQPGAAGGIFNALKHAAADPGTAPAAAPKGAPAVAPPGAPAGAGSPFGVPPSGAAKAGTPPAAVPPAVAPPADAKKAGDPFGDETPAAKPAPNVAPPAAKAAPDAKMPAPADKGGPEMKKDDDPFGKI